MQVKQTEARFRLYYWPIPFRGCFVSYLFAYRDVALSEESDFEAIRTLMSEHPSKQPVPFIGPPVLVDLESGRTLSQMPAIVLYAAGELDLIPEDPFDTAMCMKVLMDCNDVLMEICRYNGSMMWDRDAWTEFRSQRLPRWLQVFEESLEREAIGKDLINFADIGAFALFGNLMRCLPALEADVREYAPGIHAHCRELGSKASLADYVAEEERRYGNLYCGGQIEESIRRMLEMDAGN